MTNRQSELSKIQRNNMQKLYYSISEVSKLIDEEQHILRYWEKEFDNLKPRKNRAGNRVYSERDLITLKYIKKLIRDDKLSLKGAKEQLQKFLENDYSDATFIERVEEQIIAKEIPVFESNFKAGVTTFSPEIIKEISITLKEVISFLRKD